MIEEKTREYLSSKLPVSVTMETPEDITGSYIVIEKTGSGRDDHINYATLAIQSHADSMYEAAQLNELVKEAMDNMIELEGIMRSELNSDYNFTNTAIKKYRYQAVYDITY